MCLLRDVDRKISHPGPGVADDIDYSLRDMRDVGDEFKVCE